jgi:hypothetical protein
LLNEPTRCGRNAVSYLDRVLADGTDRDAWKVARLPVIGASDAKTLSKMESVPLYLRSKLKRDVFTGNVFTDNGYRWEPMILGWAGHQHNEALFHSPDEPGFAATPDGVTLLPSGGLALGEVKVKHVTLAKRTKGPTLPEWRQIAWQFRVLPEAEHLDWCWGDVDKNGDADELIDDEPKFIRIYPDDPKVVTIQAQVEPIAADLLARLRAALAFEKELSL